MAEVRYLAKDFYTYVASQSSTLNAGDNSSASVTIEADSDFFWQNATYSCFDSTDKFVLNPMLSVMLVDSANGRNLMSQAVALGDIAGTGQLPFILPHARIFNARGTIQVTFYNTSTSTQYYNVALNFTGTKMFR